MAMRTSSLAPRARRLVLERTAAAPTAAEPDRKRLRVIGRDMTGAPFVRLKGNERRGIIPNGCRLCCGKLLRFVARLGFGKGLFEAAILHHLRVAVGETHRQH